MGPATPRGEFVLSWNGCFTLCQNTPTTRDGAGYCSGFTYVGGANGVGSGTCYLKDGISEIFEARTGTNHVAAIKISNYAGAISSTNVAPEASSISSPVLPSAITTITPASTTAGLTASASDSDPPPSQSQGLPSSSSAGLHGTFSDVTSRTVTPAVSSTPPPASTPPATSSRRPFSPPPPPPPCPTQTEQICGSTDAPQADDTTSCSSPGGNSYDVACGVACIGQEISGPPPSPPPGWTDTRSRTSTVTFFPPPRMVRRDTYQETFAECQALCDSYNVYSNPEDHNDIDCVALNYINSRYTLLSTVEGTVQVPGAVTAQVGPPPEEFPFEEPPLDEELSTDFPYSCPENDGQVVTDPSGT